MKELVVIKKAVIGNDEVNSVNARELHEFMEVQSKFADWIKDRIEQYNFTEGIDFVSFRNSEKANNTYITTKEYHVSIDMAKELAMVEKNEKGKEARKYFIDCEKELKEVIVEQQKPKEIPHWSIEANGIEHVLGMLKAPAHIIASEMVKHVLNVGGPDLRGTIKELPCSQNIKDDEVMLEPTSLGKHFGLKASAMNKKLRDLGLQYHDGTGWIPTEKGSKISARNYCASEINSWTGYNRKWNLKAVKQLMKEI